MPFGARPPILNTKITKTFHRNGGFGPEAELIEKVLFPGTIINGGF